MKVAYQILNDIMCPQQMNMAWGFLSNDGKCLTDKQEVLARWIEYCSELYRWRLAFDPNVLTQHWTLSDEEELPILWDEVVHAVQVLKTGKAASADNISAKFSIHGGDTATDVLTRICNNIWQSNQWPTLQTQLLIITLPQQGICGNATTTKL